MFNKRSVVRLFAGMLFALVQGGFAALGVILALYAVSAFFEFIERI